MKKALVLCAFLLLSVLLLPRHALAAPFSHGDVVSLRHDGLGEGSFVKMKLPNTEIPSTLWAGEHLLLIEGDLYIGFCVDDVMADLINALPQDFLV